MQIDKASKALAQRLPASVPRSFRTIADHTSVPRSTLHARARGRRSIEAKAQSQQYLNQEEEKALIRFLLLMSSLDHPVRINFIRFLALSIARQRSTETQPIKPPGKNRPKAFAERHPEL